MKSRLSTEAKESIVKKALSRDDKTVAEIAYEAIECHIEGLLLLNSGCGLRLFRALLSG